MLITFIISQRKSIPAISKTVEMLAFKFGPRIKTNYEILYAFPILNEMSNATEEQLKECGLVYLIQHILDAIH